eukprot:48285_1
MRIMRSGAVLVVIILIYVLLVLMYSLYAIETNQHELQRITPQPQSFDIDERNKQRDDYSYLNAWNKKDIPYKPHHRIVLHAPHDRFNFGDLLFSKVVKKLLISGAGYKENEILMSGMVSIDMSKHDGDSNVISYKKIIQMSRNDTIAGPYDLVACGGEAAGCDWQCGVNMMPNKITKRQAKKNKVDNCAYLPSPLKLKSNSSSYTGNHPIGIFNSIGGNGGGLCKESMSHYNYISYRDKAPLAADSAVMVNYLFHDDVISRLNDKSGQVFNIQNQTNGKYFAFQASKSQLNKHDPIKLAKMFDVISNSTNLVLVFFCAGTAPGHDSIGAYENIGKYMRTKYLIMREPKAWSVVSLIANAILVFSTSLHVRIMAFIHYRPRIAFCHRNKHVMFLKLFEAKDVYHNVIP